MASDRRSAEGLRTPEEWMKLLTTPNPLATLHLSVEGQEGTATTLLCVPCDAVSTSERSPRHAAS